MCCAFWPNKVAANACRGLRIGGGMCSLDLLEASCRQWLASGLSLAKPAQHGGSWSSKLPELTFTPLGCSCLQERVGLGENLSGCKKSLS